MKTLLFNYTSDHSENRTGGRRGKLQSRQESGTTNLFSQERTRIVAHREKLVRLRVPAGVIRAVQNRGELKGIFAQHALEFATALRRLHLAFVVFAHGGDLVGEKDSAFQEIHFPEKLDSAKGEETFVQIRQAKIKPPKTALLGKMMDREHGGERQMVCAYEDGHERGRPIVHVQNLRRGVQATGQFHGGFAEKNKARGIVFILHTVFAIDCCAVEKIVAPDEK